MRIATEEEDRILQKISRLTQDNYNLENDYLLCKSQVLGYKETRRKLTVRIFTFTIISLFLLIFVIGFVLYGLKSPSLMISLFMGSGGIFAVIFIVFTLIQFIRYVAATSKSDAMASLADKFGIDNVEQLEFINKTRMTEVKNTIKNNNISIDENYKEYFALKEKNDIQYEADIKAGKIKPDTNFEYYNNFVPIDSLHINYNKTKARWILLEKERKIDAEDLDKLLDSQDKNKKSVGLFALLYGMTLLGVIGLFVLSFFQAEPYWAMVTRMLSFFALLISAIAFTLFIMNLLICLPSISDNGLSRFIADKLGVAYTKKDINDYYDKIKNTDEEIITLKAQIEEMKKEIDAEAEKEGVF